MAATALADELLLRPGALGSCDSGLDLGRRAGDFAAAPAACLRSRPRRSALEPVAGSCPFSHSLRSSGTLSFEKSSLAAAGAGPVELAPSNYAAAGDGRQVMVLFRGRGVAAALEGDWARLAEAFDGDARLVATVSVRESPGFLGFGRSRRRSGRHTVDERRFLMQF